MLFLIFLYGLLFGSFFNVVGLRIPVNQSIVSPRSACPKCGHTLSWYELIPVLSYIFQKGKCSQCKAAISLIYPIVELITGLLFILAPFTLGWSSELVVAWTLISLLMIILVSDLAYMIIPDKVLVIFTIIFIIVKIIIPQNTWIFSISGAAVGFFLLLFLAVISKGGMGGGDIKLFTVIGFVLGPKLVLLAFFLASLFGAVIGIIGMLLKHFKKREPIPFGPYIVLGTLIAYFYGSDLIDFYFQLLNI
ncbi:A24 family peptidase [Niallia sp. JL1B1071]|uniref:prepilin peptidase n=1 Tax=Niallia tiangongensis TaxID=3237105 RepID=UPI0037DC57AD